MKQSVWFAKWSNSSAFIEVFSQLFGVIIFLHKMHSIPASHKLNELSRTISSSSTLECIGLEDCMPQFPLYTDHYILIIPGVGLMVWGGGLGILGSWVQILFGCWINTRWGWLCLSSFRSRQNECQLAGILCRSGDPSRIVSNSQGDCLGSTNALHRAWSQRMDG